MKLHYIKDLINFFEEQETYNYTQTPHEGVADLIEDARQELKILEAVLEGERLLEVEEKNAKP